MSAVSTVEQESQDVWAECSDEEQMEQLGISFGHYWSPHPEELAVLYEKISKNELELVWKCPAKRQPKEEAKPEARSQDTNPPKGAEPEANDFDFEEETTPTLRRPGKSPAALKGGAKKRTTSLAGIISNMQRHRILDQKDTAEVSKSQQSTPTSRTWTD